MTAEVTSSCANCGLPTNGSAEMPPCPGCGGTTRRAHITGAVSIVATITAEVGAEYSAQRSWRERWQRLERSYEAVQKIYNGTSGGDSTEWKRTVSDFFDDCYHLADWLKRDPETKREDAMSSVRDHPHLKLADAYANTDKHHTRHKGLTEARIGGTTRTSDRGQVLIDWTDPDTGAGGRVDALDLATKCMHAWRAYLAQHGLDPR